jgi:hypothetical protein
MRLERFPPMLGDIERWVRDVSDVHERNCRQIEEMLTPQEVYTLTNVTTDRALDADAAAVAETNDVLGTLITDLQDRGIL